MPDPVCPVTGLPMVRDTRPMTIRYKGQTATFDMPGWYCGESGESIHTGDDMKVSDRELARLKGTIEGLLPPAEVRRVRKRLGLTQREASTIVGGGRNAFQKYESGETLPSQAISNLLKVLERHPEEVEILRRAHEQRMRHSGHPSAA
jgi:HTH-type transcriptional regulator/antitoxin MqsA